MQPRHLIHNLAVFAVLLALPVSARVSARTMQAFDAGCRTRPADACPADSGPNPLLSLAGVCAENLKAETNCCAYRKSAAREYAIVKDCAPGKPQGYLLVPVKAITGVDDPQIFGSGFVDLWQEAWRWSKEFPGQPASRTALAINSARSRSEKQLHIHISCVDPEVIGILEKTEIPFYPAKPSALTDLGPGHRTYRAVKVRKLTGGSSPFRVARRQVGRSAMTHQGIAVIGSAQEHAYYVLDTSEEDGRGGHAEELLDQTCTK